MEEEKRFCVVAAERQELVRRAITGPLSRSEASREKAEAQRTLRRTHKYFSVAVWPYKPRVYGK